MQIITVAPELENSSEVIRELFKRNIIVSLGNVVGSGRIVIFNVLLLGHSIADLAHGEAAVNEGASLITHLFNAMLPVSILVINRVANFKYSETFL